MTAFRHNALSLAGAAVVLLLTLMPARPTRASSAALVSMSGPVSAEATSVPVSNLVTLTATTVVGATVPFHEVSSSGSYVFLVEYVVPAGKTFVITSVEISPIQSGATSAPAHVFVQGPAAYFPFANAGYGNWLVSNQVMTELEYPTGIVMGAGIYPKMSAEMDCVVTLHGYLVPA